MAIGKDFLWQTLETVVADLERADPQSVVAARTRGILTMRVLMTASGDRHPRSKKALRDDRIAELYLGGATIAEVGRGLGHAVETVKKALARRGIEARKAGDSQKTGAAHKSAERVERIRQMRSAGKTLEEIGAAEKITRERVRQICFSHHIDTSSRPLTPDELASVHDYLNGDSLDAVAERHEITLGALKNFILRSGNNIRPGKRKPKHSQDVIAKAERAAELYAEGKTTGDIAEALGANRNGATVYRLLAIAGVAPDRQRRPLSA